MKIAVVRYRTQNIGDDIQSLALERLLPRVDLRIDRDDLTPARDWGEDVRWVINGWYASGAHKHWPPRTRAKTLFVGLHANDPDAIPRTAAGPIGCRDPWTIHLCARHGIDAWLSWCATLTLEPAYGPRTDEVLLVDVASNDLERLPPRIAAGTKLSHTVPRDCDRVAEATRRLQLYAKARWVVTNRLHVLLPCAAMGTPVTLVRPPNSENRFTGYAHLGWRIADAPWDEPRPRMAPDLVHAMAAPLRDAVRRFVDS
jgi:hypothetical protein